MVLSGHLHSTIAAPFATAPGLLFVQAGTGLSTRVRGEPNTFNLIEAAPGRVTITTHAAGTERVPPGSGSPLPPRRQRLADGAEASTLFSFSAYGGAYDHEDDATYLPAGKVRIVDMGDADIVHTDTLSRVHGVRKLLAAGALPVVLGGDHSRTISSRGLRRGLRGSRGRSTSCRSMRHLDFVDVRHGVRTVMAARCGGRPSGPM